MTCAGPIVLSLNEVETLSAKASRGAGLGWGQAEDLGRASRWLAEHSWAWADPLLKLLGDEVERASLVHALALADRCAGAPLQARWRTPACSLRWAVPIVAAAIHGRARAVDLRAANGTVRIGGDDALSSDMPLADRFKAPLTVRSVEILTPGEDPALVLRLLPTTRRSPTTAATYAALDALAARTYVAASATSRARGAGGAGLDGD